MPWTEEELKEIGAKAMCVNCGLPLGGAAQWITMNGDPYSTGKHIWLGSASDGCRQALVDEVIRLRQQIDYLTDLVEAPVELLFEAAQIKSISPTIGQVMIGTQWKDLKVKQLGGPQGSSYYVVAE